MFSKEKSFSSQIFLFMQIFLFLDAVSAVAFLIRMWYNLCVKVTLINEQGDSMILIIDNIYVLKKLFGFVSEEIQYDDELLKQYYNNCVFLDNY